MNAHRTALRAIAEQTASEQRQAHGSDALALARMHAALVAAINAGDEAEAAEVEIVEVEIAEDDDTWNADVRKGIEARITLDALRRALARTLGRPTVRRQILGPDVDVAPPVDGVLLADVEAVARRSGEYGTLRSDLAAVLGVDVLDDARLLAIARERMVNAEHAQEVTTETEVRLGRLLNALHVLGGVSDDIRTDPSQLLALIAEHDPALADRYDAAAAALAGDTNRED